MGEMTRVCHRCGAVKAVWEFPLQPKMASGRDVRCADCVREHERLFRLKLRSKDYVYKLRGEDA